MAKDRRQNLKHFLMLSKNSGSVRSKPLHKKQVADDFGKTLRKFKITGAGRQRARLRKRHLL